MAPRPEKIAALESLMKELGIRDEDLLEKFILGSGKGGQKMNKTHSCVYLKHLPTGLEVKMQKERSRELNRFLARRELCEKYRRQVLKEKTEKQQAIDKVRRQKKRRSKKAKEKMLESKKQRGAIKALRQPPSPE